MSETESFITGLFFIVVVILFVIGSYIETYERGRKRGAQEALEKHAKESE